VPQVFPGSRPGSHRQAASDRRDPRGTAPRRPL